MGQGAKELQARFITFSAGPGAASNVSYLEQTVLLASVLHRYGFVLPHAGWEQDRWGPFNVSAVPMPLKVRRRDLGGGGMKSVIGEFWGRADGWCFVGGTFCRYDTVMASQNDSNKFSLLP